MDAKQLAERIDRECFHIRCAGAINHNRIEAASFDRGKCAAILASALQPQWVSVTPETLPKERAEVFITASMDGERLDGIIAFRVGTDWYGVHEADYDWVISDDWGVTHWMPLPAPPTEQNERAEEQR